MKYQEKSYHEYLDAEHEMPHGTRAHYDFPIKWNHSAWYKRSTMKRLSTIEDDASVYRAKHINDYAIMRIDMGEYHAKRARERHIEKK